MRIGCLTVLDDYLRMHEKHGTRIKWRVRCDCGNEFYIDRYSLLHNIRNSCNKCKKPGIRNEKLYHVYYGMLQRCYNKNNHSYKNYGMLGVTVCDEWMHNYNSFKEWANSNGYQQGLTIDRIDSKGPYCPENCRWVTLSENSRRANIGRHKNHSKLDWMYAINLRGERIEINNITKFCKDNDLNYSNVSAILHGRIKNSKYKGWAFYSNKIQSNTQLEV